MSIYKSYFKEDFYQIEIKKNQMVNGYLVPCISFNRIILKIENWTSIFNSYSIFNFSPPLLNNKIIRISKATIFRTLVFFKKN